MQNTSVSRFSETIPGPLDAKTGSCHGSGKSDLEWENSVFLSVRLISIGHVPNFIILFPVCLHMVFGEHWVLSDFEDMDIRCDPRTVNKTTIRLAPLSTMTRTPEIKSQSSRYKMRRVDNGARKSIDFIPCASVRNGSERRMY